MPPGGQQILPRATTSGRSIYYPALELTPASALSVFEKRSRRAYQYCASGTGQRHEEANRAHQPCAHTARHMRTVVVLDTNAGWSDVFLQGPAATALLEWRKSAGLEIVVPEVVVLETVKHYPDRARKAVVNAANSRREMLALGLPAGDPVEEPDVAAFEESYRKRLVSARVRVAGPPDTTPAVSWAVDRRKPFRDSGVGFQDTLIWLTVLDLAADVDEVIFVTDNIRDFADPNDAATLAPELKQDLIERGMPSTRVRIVRSIRDTPTGRRGPPQGGGPPRQCGISASICRLAVHRIAIGRSAERGP